MEFLMTLVFLVLLVEIVFCTFFMLPVSMHLRKNVYNKLDKLFGGQNAKIFLKVLALLVIIVFCDSIVNSYNINKKLHTPELTGAKFDRQNEYTRMFRYQRNSYICGFCLYLFFLIYRSQGIISQLSNVEASKTAIEKQTKNNLNTVETLLSENEKLKTEIKDLKKMEKEHKAMKSQAENTTKEYLKLQEEYNQLLGKKPKTQKKDD
ncbi:hypothetical protein ACTFIT_000161 [Dictyostelium discoideum]|uniref:Endoplasmic reticulum transmembrane protein YET-like n=2 Tax=Dictyostelium discoideum TaxID=44689 RepID=YETL_DICDI|nr:RecName: Full=Endoplasmic reticulum transmembrane protein YET-like [Dictyostelium discoideum]